jgi:hypothetical protein
MRVEVLFPSSQEASEEKLNLAKLFGPFSVTKQAFQSLKKFQQNNGAWLGPFQPNASYQLQSKKNVVNGKEIFHRKI